MLKYDGSKSINISHIIFNNVIDDAAYIFKTKNRPLTHMKWINEYTCTHKVVRQSHE